MAQNKILLYQSLRHPLYILTLALGLAAKCGKVCHTPVGSGRKSNLDDVELLETFADGPVICQRCEGSYSTAKVKKLTL
jgi:hypothetical protein